MGNKAARLDQEFNRRSECYRCSRKKKEREKRKKSDGRVLVKIDRYGSVTGVIYISYGTASYRIQTKVPKNGKY